MKILFLHSDSFGGFGGISKFNRDFMTAACSCPGAEVVALPRLIPEAVGDLPAGLVFDQSGVGGKGRFSFAALRAARRHAPFDLVICGHINLLPIARLCQRLSGGKLGLIIHGIDAWQPNKSAMVNSIVKKLDFFVAVSEFTLQKFCDWSKTEPTRGFILPNCVELEKFGPGPKNPELLRRYGMEGKTIIMTTGRLVSRERCKGFDEILEVMPQLVNLVPEIAYLIVGDGDDRRRLEEKALTLEVADRVVFTGRVPEEEKADHYRLADLYVMPSRGEGFGIVFLEAMACGIPCIGSMVDGSREALIGGELGQLVDPEDKVALHAAILEGLLRPRDNISERLQYFSFDSFKQRLHSMVENQFLG